MYRSVKILMLVLAVGAMLAICAPYDSTAHVNQPAGGKFTGVPRDVDFIKNSGWTQVILQGSDELVAQTKNECIEGIVLVAFSMKSGTFRWKLDVSSPKSQVSSLRQGLFLET